MPNLHLLKATFILLSIFTKPKFPFLLDPATEMIIKSLYCPWKESTVSILIFLALFLRNTLVQLAH